MHLNKNECLCKTDNAIKKSVPISSTMSHQVKQQYLPSVLHASGQPYTIHTRTHTDTTSTYTCPCYITWQCLCQFSLVDSFRLGRGCLSLGCCSLDGVSNEGFSCPPARLDGSIKSCMVPVVATYVQTPSKLHWPHKVCRWFLQNKQHWITRRDHATDCTSKLQRVHDKASCQP